jgi:ATPase subunit of ABC transporter with duplicated ATPase domains
MPHRPISIQTLGLCFPHKVCFTDFSAQVHDGDRIAIIGQNGSGKSTLLQILQGRMDPSEGNIHVPEDVSFGYVPQVIEGFRTLSGGQRLNEALSLALSPHPNVLLLDEPTNHLDGMNRRSLMRHLQKFPGTLIVISHDVDLLRTCVNSLWHIEDGKISIFRGNYDDYRFEIIRKRNAIEDELTRLNRQKKEAHQSLMKEQARAKNSRLRGEKHIKQRKWPTIVSDAKARRAEETSGHKKNEINRQRQDLVEQLADLRLPEIIVPKFTLKACNVSPTQTVISIQEGSCGYGSPLLNNIFLDLKACDRLAITGDNGSGKTTLVRAIMNDELVIKSGGWLLPKREDIGYLDQHYATLNPFKTVLETIQEIASNWSHEAVRRHLNDFLFRKNEEVTALVSTLSGGEKVRLSLAQIATKTPRLLILDEITNNLDLETRTHVMQVLQQYPGALLVISHDEDFLKEIGIQNFYDLKNEKTRIFKMINCLYLMNPLS